MSNTNIKVKAQTLKNFFAEKGHKVKHSECLEAVSVMETGNCYNVAKEKTIRILKEGENLTFKEMKATNFQIDVIIPMNMITLMSGIESVNDRASEMITSCDYALCDIGYEVYPHYYGTSSVALHVTGHISDTQTLENLNDYEFSDFAESKFKLEIPKNTIFNNICHRDSLELELAALYPKPFVVFPIDGEEGDAKCFDTMQEAQDYAKS